MGHDPRERDLVKCEDMRIHAERAIQYRVYGVVKERLPELMGNLQRLIVALEQDTHWPGEDPKGST